MFWEVELFEKIFTFQEGTFQPKKKLLSKNVLHFRKLNFLASHFSYITGNGTF